MISCIDADGVVLAGIRGLHPIDRESMAEVAELGQQTAEIAELRRKATELDTLKTTTAQPQRELAELRGIVEVLLARTNLDSRVAQQP